MNFRLLRTNKRIIHEVQFPNAEAGHVHGHAQLGLLGMGRALRVLAHGNFPVQRIRLLLQQRNGSQPLTTVGLRGITFGGNHA